MLALTLEDTTNEVKRPAWSVYGLLRSCESQSV